MRRRHWIPLMAAACLAAPAITPATTTATPSSTPRTWIVRFSDAGAANAQTGRMRAQGHAPERRFSHVLDGMSVTLDDTAATALRRQPGVVSVQPDRVIHAASTQSFPPVGLDRVDQRTSRPSRSYTSTMTGAGVRIYVVDSGINLAHADFSGRIVKGPDYADATAAHPATSLAPADCYGHGTHVAGIAAGTRVGVAKKATVVPVKVLDCRGDGTASDFITALEWVAGDHARTRTPAVVNLSLSTGMDTNMDAAVAKLVNLGITVTSAAGNSGDDACNWSPGRVPGSITVASATTDSRQAARSNRGPCVDIFAPGTGIVSDWIGSTTATNTETGTSMATAFVSGAAALVLQARPTYRPADVARELLGKATPHALADVSAHTPNRLLYTRGGVNR